MPRAALLMMNRLDGQEELCMLHIAVSMRTETTTHKDQIALRRHVAIKNGSNVEKRDIDATNPAAG
jgi:hypothetical protein